MMTDADASLNAPLVTAISEEEDPAQNQPQHLCCGCCCNTRYSVICVQFFFGILFPIFWIVDWSSGTYEYRWTGDRDFPEDKLEELRGAYEKIAILNMTAIAVGVVVIIGALKYNLYAVSLGLIYTAINLILESLFLYPVVLDYLKYPYAYIVIPVILAVLIIYPHAALIYEIKKGIMVDPAIDLRVEDSSLFEAMK